MGIAVLGLVFLGVLAFKSDPQAQNLSAANVTAYNALNNQSLVNELNLIANPLVGWLSGSATMGNLTIGSTTVQSSTITVTGAVPGDYLEWSESTSTTNALLSCTVSAANTIVCTKSTAVPGSAGIAAVTSTVTVTDMPASVWKTVTGL